MTSMKGLEDESFSTCYEMAEIVNPEAVKVPFLYTNHLIANKKTLNRPKDQMDVLQLEEIKKLQEKGN
jgi:hypothetical protein